MILLAQSAYTLPTTTTTLSTSPSPMSTRTAPLTMSGLSIENGFGAIGHAVGGDAAARRFHAGIMSGTGTGAGAPPHAPSHPSHAYGGGTLGPRHGLGQGQGSPPMVGGLVDGDGLRNGSGVNLGSRTGDWR